MLDLYQVGILVIVASIAAIACERLRIPYTVGLVVAGLGLAISPIAITLPLSKTLIYSYLLPQLVFEAALRIDWRQMRRDLPVIGILAGPGLLVAASIAAAGMHWLIGWSWAAAALFGILIAATDPVTVIATFDEAGVVGRLNLLVRAEALANDGVAAVAFGLALIVIGGASTSIGEMSLRLCWTIVGGVSSGIITAAALLIVAGRTANHLVELTLTTLAAYGSFLLAERFGASGVLASLAAGLVIGGGGFGSNALTIAGQDAVKAFWEFAAFLTNSLIFILIGVRVAFQDFASALWIALAAIAIVIGARAITVYTICRLFKNTDLAVPLKHQHILFWGGLRGALALALVLGLPETLPNHDAVVKVTFAVVVFSIFVQTLSVTPLLRRLHIIAS